VTTNLPEVEDHAEVSELSGILLVVGLLALFMVLVLLTA